MCSKHLLSLVSDDALDGPRYIIKHVSDGSDDFRHENGGQRGVHAAFQTGDASIAQKVLRISFSHHNICLVDFRPIGSFVGEHRNRGLSIGKVGLRPGLITG